MDGFNVNSAMQLVVLYSLLSIIWHYAMMHFPTSCYLYLPCLFAVDQLTTYLHTHAAGLLRGRIRHDNDVALQALHEHACTPLSSCISETIATSHSSIISNIQATSSHDIKFTGSAAATTATARHRHEQDGNCSRWHATAGRRTGVCGCRCVQGHGGQRNDEA